MRFKVLTATQVLDTPYGEEFEYEPGAPSFVGEAPDGTVVRGAPYNVDHWLNLGLVAIVGDDTRAGAADAITDDVDDDQGDVDDPEGV